MEPNVHLLADGPMPAAAPDGTPARRTFVLDAPFGLAVDLATLTVRAEGGGSLTALRVVEIAVGPKLVFVAAPRMAMPLADFLIGGRAPDTVARWRLPAGRALTVVVENPTPASPVLVWSASGYGVAPSS